MQVASSEIISTARLGPDNTSSVSRFKQPMPLSDKVKLSDILFLFFSFLISSINLVIANVRILLPKIKFI